MCFSVYHALLQAQFKVEIKKKKKTGKTSAHIHLPTKWNIFYYILTFCFASYGICTMYIFNILMLILLPFKMFSFAFLLLCCVFSTSHCFTKLQHIAWSFSTILVLCQSDRHIITSSFINNKMERSDNRNC